MAIEARDRIQSAHACLDLREQPLVPAIVVSQAAVYGGGGLIPALIDGSINSKRQKDAGENLACVLRELEDYDANAKLKQALRECFDEVAWLGDTPVDEVEEIDREELTKFLTTTGADALLTFMPLNDISPDFNEIRVTVDVAIYLIPDGIARRAAGPHLPSYRAQLVSSGRLETYFEDRVDASKAWAAEDGRRIEGAIDAGIREVASMFVHDVQLVEKIEDGDRASLKVFGSAVSGPIVREQDGRVWLREKSTGVLYAGPAGSLEP